MGGQRSRRRTFGTIRQLPSGRFQAAYRGLDGQRHTGPMTYPTRAAAERWLATIETDVVRGTWRAPNQQKITIAQYVARYIDSRPIRITTRKRYLDSLRHISRYPIGGKLIDQVTPDQVRDWLDALRADLAKTKANNWTGGKSAAAKTYGLLRSSMRQAEYDELIWRSPCRVRGGDTVTTPERPTASLTEIFAIAQHFPARYRAMPVIAAFYQVRRGELLALTRIDVEPGGVRIDKRIYPILGGLDLDTPKTKAGLRTLTPIGFVDAIVEDHLAGFVGPEPCALLFTTRTGRPVTHLHSIWDKARKAIGRPDLHWHDLRGSGATLLRMAGATDEEIKARLGQSSTAAARIYLHTTGEHSLGVSRRMSEALEAHAAAIPLAFRGKRAH